MFRLFSNAFRPRIFTAVTKNVTENIPRVANFQFSSTFNFSTLTNKPLLSVSNKYNACCGVYKSVLSNPQFNDLQTPPSRNVTKFSKRSGKRKSVKTVLRRFYRLNWGMWIRTMAGRHKRLWKKSPKRRQKLRRHVFTTASQNRLLDTMVTSFWRRPKYYVDDPYEPYHTREEFWITRKKPIDR